MRLTFLLFALFLGGPIFANLEVEIETFQEKQIITFYGGMDKGDFKLVKPLLNSLEKNRPTTLRILRGFGGEVSEHKKFINEIRKYCPVGNCELTTVLEGQCSSMCTTLYLSGDKRLAHDHSFANLAFHRTQIQVFGRIVPIQTPKSMARYFQKFSGVNKDYIWENRNKLFKQPNNGLYHVSGQELIIAGFSQQLIDSLSF